MKHVIFDIEGNGLGEYTIKNKKPILECTLIHLLVLRSYPDGEVKVFRKNDEEDTIAEGWEILRQAEVVVGHHIIQYDLPVLSRLYGSGDWRADIKAKVFDTLVAARVLWPDAKNHPFGGNSLECFGMHLKCYKGDYTGGWESWNPEMESYCIQDTDVGRRIFDFIKPKCQRFKNAIRLEHRVATICSSMMRNGVRIDVDRAETMIDQFDLIKAQVMQQLHEVFPPRIETMKTPAYWFLPDGEKPPTESRRWPTKSKAPKKLQGLLKKGPLQTKDHPFNPGSALQVSERLKEKYDWEPTLTEKGNPSVTEEILRVLPYPEAGLLLQHGMADKRLQHLSDWVTRARNCRTPGIIHPQINTCGCATSRPSHQQPNQTACPKVLVNKGGPIMGYAGRYGWEMRSLWGPTQPGWLMVGGDASGLELRLLGSALAIFDGGAYAREVVSGDIHTLNQKAGGLSYRDQAKTVIYAYLYGAGNAHIGLVICTHPSLPKVEVQAYAEKRDEWMLSKKGQRKKRGRDAGQPYTEADWYAIKGKAFRDTFETKLPALAQLRAWCVQCASEKGFVPLIDGRHAPIRSEHSALNSYLQGNGAILMKVAMVLCDNRLKKLKLRCGWMLWPHDEFQLEAHPDDAEAVGKTIVWAIEQAGKVLRVKCPMTGKFKIGKNWAETH